MLFNHSLDSFLDQALCPCFIRCTISGHVVYGWLIWCVHRNSYHKCLLFHSSSRQDHLRFGYSRVQHNSGYCNVQKNHLRVNEKAYPYFRERYVAPCQYKAQCTSIHKIKTRTHKERQQGTLVVSPVSDPTAGPTNTRVYASTWVSLSSRYPSNCTVPYKQGQGRSGSFLKRAH